MMTPSPLEKRIAIRAIPTTMIVPVMTLKGVPIFPFGFISEARNRANSRTAWREFRALPGSLFFLFMVFPLVPVSGEVVQADEEGRTQNEDKGDAVQEPRRVLRVGRRPQVGPEPELLERDGGEVQGPAATDLVLPVDGVDVLVGVLADPGPGDLEQLPPRPEEGGVLGAGIHAGGTLAGFQPVVAEDALPDVREGAFVLELRDVVGARDHAVPAPHAPVLVVDDRPFHGFLHRFGQACRGAGGLAAVQALPPHEDRAVRVLRVRVPVEDRERAWGGVPLLLEDAVAREGDLRLGQPVLIVARLLTAAAADAFRRVDQQPVELGAGHGRLRTSGSARKQAAARHAGKFQEIPSVHAHRYPSSRYGAAFGPGPPPEET